MKKLLLLLVLLGIMVLMGCVPGKVCNAPYKQIGERCCMDLNENGVCDDNEAPYQEEQAAVTGMGLLDTYLNNVKAYSYVLDESTYFVAGDHVKKVLPRQEKVAVEQPVGEKQLTMVWIDTVYFQRGEEPVATAYCEGVDVSSERLCSGFGLWDLPITVDYDQYYVKTPDEWLKEFAGKMAETIEEKFRFVIPAIEVTRLTFVEPGLTTILDVDPITGIVWYAETIDDKDYKIVYDYKDEMRVNNVPETEYIHQVRTEPEQADFNPAN